MLRALAIILSLLAAVALAFGAQFQNDSVEKNTDKEKGEKKGVGLGHILELIRNPRWLGGMGFLVLGASCQIAALTMAPLIVVQPIGALALVITSLLNARATKTRITKATWVAISLCTGGIATFVSLATGIASDQKQLSDGNLVVILSILGVLLLVLGAVFLVQRQKMNALTFILGAGLLYGILATLVKSVIQRIQQSHFEWLTVVCLVAALLAMALGGWFVQNAYASGPPDLVIAGLTVVDPMVAVSIGIIVLGEAAQAADNPLIAIVFAASGAVAATGVWLLSRVHPELKAQRS
jgi:drug/metabolite transporter (DMT)-like permease